MLELLQLVIGRAKAQPLARHGEIGNGRADESRGSDRTSTRGETQSYLLRRIARDMPELLDQIGPDKPHRSARAAAIAAGWRRLQSLSLINSIRAANGHSIYSWLRSLRSQKCLAMPNMFRYSPPTPPADCRDL